MKKRILLVLIITFIMLLLLPGGAALAVTFEFNAEETVADNTITETNGGYTLQITSSNPSDYVTNLTMDTTVPPGTGPIPFATTLMDGFVVCVTGPSGNERPFGTVTVSLASGGSFSLNGFYCGNAGGNDNLIITAGTTTDTFSVNGAQEAHIVPKTTAAFQGITSFTIDWAENPVDEIANPHCMFFDKFDISFNPVITTQPGNASVASGGNTGFSVAAVGNTLTYQWQVDTTGLGSSFNSVTNGGVYSGASTAALSITGATSGMNNNLYRCVVTDGGGNTATSDSAKLTILAQAPTDIALDNASIPENTASGTKVGGLTTTDADSSFFTYSLAESGTYTDNAYFTIVDGELRLNMVPNFESKTSYSIRIQTQDEAGLTYVKTFAIAITDVNEKPTDISLSNSSIAENSASGTEIGILSGTDPDAGAVLSYSLPGGVVDNASFTISENSLKLAVVPDFEAKDTYSVLIRESDGSLTFDKIFTIIITDVEEAPKDISLSASEVTEHSAVGTTIGALSSADQDMDQLPDDFDYVLVAGEGATDNASFSISVDTLKIMVSPDFEVKSSYSIRVRTTDSTGRYYEKVFTITVRNGIDPPTDISLTKSSIAENSPGGTVIGNFGSTDISGPGPFTYTFASGIGDTDNGFCIIDGNALKLLSAPNYEVKNSYSIRIRTTNDITHFYCDKAFTIAITDVNETPTGINLSSTNITEHISSGTTVAVITGIDPDAGSTFTYSLVSGIGDADNAAFTISGNELKLKVEPDYEVRPTYNIRIKVTDNGSLTYEKDFILIVINGNDPPADLYMTSSSIQENTPSGVVFTLFGCVDINGGIFSYSLVNGTGSTDNDKFTLSGNALSMSVVPDYETKASYNIRVRVTDSGGLYYEKAFTIAVENMSEAPTDIGLSNSKIAENNPSGTAVGILSGVDQDAGSTFTYSLVSGTGGTDNAFFAITGNKLQTAAIFDYEAKNSYSIRVRVTDNTGLWYEKQFTISVSVPVTSITVTGTGGATSVLVGNTLQMLADVSPADAADKSVTWSIASGSGATISAGGMLTATVAGSVTVRSTANDGTGVYGERAITITAPPSDGDDGNQAATPTYKAEVEPGTGSDTTMPVTVDTEKGSAGVNVGTGNGLMSEGKTAVITVPSVPNVDTYTLGIPVPDLSTPDERGALSFNTGAGSVTVPSDMLTGVTGISGARAEIAIGQGDKTRLPEAVKGAIGDKPLVQLTLSVDGKQTSWNNPGAPVTVSIPYTPTATELANPESIVVWYIDGSGKVVSIPNGHYNPATGTVTFETTHFSDYAVAYNPVSFSDVAPNAWYSKAVSFVAARKITSGTGNGKYSPEAKLTRGEFIVLVMRAYGIAADENPTDNFSDAGNTGYTGYLSAAKRLRITVGVGNNMFAPGKEITRQEMFTLLYNALKIIGRLPGTHGGAVSDADGQPQGDFGKKLSDFTDAGQINEWAREAMATFVATGTVSGSAGKIAPTATTTRAEMAQVLYNLLGK